MKTDMVVSCPKCAVENTVTMELQAGGISEFLAMIMPETKQYTFFGETKCVCGETINAILTVENVIKSL
ncbi:MAG: hypothetical protein LBQ89_08080 [Treponema sp.]|jgi:predicted nucleic-acid-binding Zn-ribbon protein|nr:hypothetical protein [Treponema sp.]